MSLVLRYGPYAAIAVFFWLWISAREDLATEIERCETEKAISIAEANRLGREAIQSALETRIAQLEQVAANADRAREIAEQARQEAESRPLRVQEVVRRVADRNACIDLPLPDELAQCLRQGADCSGSGDTRSGQD